MADLRSVVVVVLAAPAAMLALPAGASAQSCGPQWLPGHGVPGVVQGSNLLPISASILWDPDGEGPEEEWLVVGGEFVFAGTVHTSGIARWKPSTGEWAPIGGGITGDVRALAVLPNNDLVAAGAFTTAGGVPARNIARWDGTTWHPFGPGLSGTTSAWVYDLAIGPHGDLLAVGNLISPGPIARWDGASWSAYGAPLTPSYASVDEIEVTDTGEIVVAGSFFTAGGHASAYFARLSDSGAPWVALHPEPQSVAPAANVVFEAVPAKSYSNVSYHWLRNGQPIADGPSGASPGGGTVSGASGVLPSPTDGAPAVLTITNVQPSDAGVYTVVFTNPCGSATSHPATLTVACPADWNHDTLINSADISAYLASWLGSLNNNNLDADFDNSGSVNSADISAFLAAWLDALTQGC